jgi:hypothetical protein
MHGKDRLLCVARSLVVLLLGAAVSSRAGACDIPVFRYALERWRPDPYQVVVFHQGPASEELQAVLAHLRKAARGPGAVANISVTALDLAADREQTASMAVSLLPSASCPFGRPWSTAGMLSQVRQTSHVWQRLLKVWKAQEKAKLPWMVVLYPEPQGIEQPVWSGPPTEQAVSSLLDSPARRQIVHRLMTGESAVWLLLEGDKEQTEATARLLEEELPRLEKELQLPNKDLKPPKKPLPLPSQFARSATELLSPVPLRISFSMLRVDRTDPREALFVAQLVRADEGLALEDGPIVYPIVGRGRGMAALVAGEVDADTVRALCQSLCGACSCQIKWQNPGVDLLMTAPWSSLIGGEVPPETTPSVTEGTTVQLPDARAYLASAETSGAPDEGGTPGGARSYRWLLWVATGVASVLVLLTGGILLGKSRKRTPPPSQENTEH